MKPDGLTIYRPEDIPATLENMPIQELCGIGRRLGRQLHSFGIFTCGQLGRFPVEILRKKYGVIGERLHDMAHGVDNSPIVSEEHSAPIKSVGHSRTLRDDLENRKSICAFLLQLAEMVGRRARRYQVSGRVVTLTMRYADFSTFSRQQVQPEYLSDSEMIYRAAVQILDGLEVEQPVRLLGIRLSSLRFQTGQLPLFPAERRRHLLTEARDIANDRYGDFTIMFGSLLEQKGKGSHVISPSWRPDGVRNVEVS
jgi:DNA polymerase-4